MVQLGGIFSPYSRSVGVKAVGKNTSVAYAGPRGEGAWCNDIACDTFGSI